MRSALTFAVLTALCWGLYGPTLAVARGELKSPFKPYLCIGLAYLVWSIVGGSLGIVVRKESFAMSGGGLTWGFMAGTLGAWGAFNLTMAMVQGGSAKPHVVMSIVFGGAVTVAALVGAWQTRGQETSPWLWVGIAGMLICASVVAYNTPSAHPAAPKPGAAASSPHVAANPAAVEPGPPPAGH